MAKEQDIEKLYEFIERLDFNELSENEKSFVLKHVSQDEYNSMRSTISDTRDLFIKYPEAAKKDKNITFKKIVTYPVELYKIAAFVVFLIGIGIILSQANTSDQQELLARIDTVIVETTDTVEVIKDRIVYKELPSNQIFITSDINDLETAYSEIDCSTDICPDDLELLGKTDTEGNFSHDSSLSDFIVSF